MQVEDYSIENVSGGNIAIDCMLTAAATLISSREVASIVADDETICQKEDEMLVNTLVGSATETFEVESEFAIKEPVRKVISTDSSAVVKTVESGVNFVSVGGEVITRLLYLTENDRFETAYVTENFKEEVELEGVTRESVSDAAAYIKQSSIKCQTDAADKGVNIKVIIPVMLKVESYLEKPVNVIKDIYCTQNDLQVSTSSFEMSKQYPCELLEAKIDGALTLDEDKPRVDKIMFVGGSNLCVTNSYIKGGEVFVEGVAKTNVVYLNDETNTLHSAVVEVPFVVSDKTDCSEDAQITVNATLTDVDVVVKKGREFLFDAKLKISLCCCQGTVGAVISSVESGEEYPPRDCAIELVFATTGQTAWDIGKQIKVKEDSIVFQNPDLTFPLEKDESVVVYYKLR